MSRICITQIGSYCQPMKPIKSFFSKIRYKLFVLIIEWEIYHRIFPHLQKNKKCQYPFNSDCELLKATVQHSLEADYFIKTISNRAEKMDRAYGEAFRYIMYRDISERMKMFEQLVKQRTYPPLWNPRSVRKTASPL